MPIQRPGPLSPASTPSAAPAAPPAWLGRLAPVAVGAGLRIWALIVHPHRLIWDETSFHELASRLAGGQPYGLPFWPPVWPYTLAGLYRLFGPDPRLGLWFNGLVSILMLALTGALAARLLDRRSAQAAVWIMALMPSYILANTLLIYDVLLQFLLILAVFLALQVQWTWQRVVGLGLLGGIIGLLRPTWLLLPLALWLANRFTSFRPPLRRGMLAQSLAVLVTIPWIIYASGQAGYFTPVALVGSHHLWMANNPNATGTHVNPPTGYSDARYEAQARQEAVEFLLANPLHPLKLLPAKLWYMFRGEAYISWFQTKSEPEISPLILNAANGSYVLMLLFALLGAGLATYRRERPLLLLLIPSAYIVAAQVILFTGQLKYRWSWQFILILFAAAGLVWTWQALTLHRKAELGPA